VSHDEDRDERPEQLEATGQLLGAGVPGVLPREGAATVSTVVAMVNLRVLIAWL